MYVIIILRFMMWNREIATEKVFLLLICFLQSLCKTFPINCDFSHLCAFYNINHLFTCWTVGKGKPLSFISISSGNVSSLASIPSGKYVWKKIGFLQWNCVRCRIKPEDSKEVRVIDCKLQSTILIRSYCILGPRNNQTVWLTSLQWIKQHKAHCAMWLGQATRELAAAYWSKNWKGA